VGESLLNLPLKLFETVADTVGTPVYVYSVQAIRDQWRMLEAALADVPHRVHFSVKANSNLAVLNVLRDLGAGVDIVSGAELSRAQLAGFMGAEIVFSGVGKTAAELRRAAEAHVSLINVESDVEFAALAAVVSQYGLTANVGIRVNPNVTTDTHPYTQTGHSGLKFGVPLDQVEELALRMHHTPGVRLTGIGMHLGSQISDPSRYEEGIEQLLTLVRLLQGAGVSSLRSLDIGGGFAVSYGIQDGLDLTALSQIVKRIDRETGLETLLEPGRYLTANAGFLLTRVLYRKSSGGRSFVIIDAGMNDFIRPSYYQAHHEIAVVTSGEISATDRAGPVDVVGPICETSDFQALNRSMPPVGPNALLAICGAGAYGFSMSSTYNSRPRAAEVLIDGDRFAIIRERERVDHLWMGENLEPEWQTMEGRAEDERREEIA
jgi:diaminopimelate decarboxylase